MKQRFYVTIESKKPIDPKDVLFAIREARPNWGEMSASLAAEQPLAVDVCRATGGEHVWVTAADYGEVCGSCGTRH